MEVPSSLFEFFTTPVIKDKDPLINREVLVDVIARVDRGMAKLDKVDPDWIANINLKHLNMANASQCVLGQVFGDYHETMSSSEENQGQMPMSATEAAECGFTSRVTEDSSYTSGIWQALDIVWSYKISYRNTNDPCNLLEVPSS